ncbi:MAG: ParA family protein [Gammaproteobacteria bacterium]|nr:ParA family protein [Gammaproteobacteria bacterium]
MSIITLATTKGGAGKTTLAQVIVGNVYEQGFSVGVIDGDVNNTLSDWLERFSKIKVDCHRIQDETQIVPMASALERKHDLVVIDTAGARSQATVFAIGCADLVLIPLQLSSSDVIEAIKTYNLVASASEMVKREIPSRVVYTDYTPKTNIAKYVKKRVKKHQLPTMKTRLHRLVAFKELTFTGDVPKTGTAGAQGQLLVQEIQKMGLLPFMDELRMAS